MYYHYNNNNNNNNNNNKAPLGFWDTERAFNLARWTDLEILKKKKKKKKKKKRTSQIVDFAVLADHRVKLKERKNRDESQDLAREEKKKLRNMKMTVIPTVIGVLSTLTKRLVQGLEDLEIRQRVENIQTTALLRSARMLRRVLETCCYLNSSDKPSASARVKTLKRIKFFSKRGTRWD